MSAPEHQHPIDPISEALGALKADVRGLRAELRVWGSIILAILFLLAGAVFRLAERLPS
jgi:hypothetical protein